MNEFAKIFETEECVQVVAIKQGSDDSGGEIGLFFQPVFQPAILGARSLATSSKEGGSGWKACCDIASDKEHQQ